MCLVNVESLSYLFDHVLIGFISCIYHCFCGLTFGEVIFSVLSHQSVKMQVTQLDLHRHFHSLGAGVIEEVRIQRDKGFGFVRYSNHSEAALAIQMGNGRILCGKPIKVVELSGLIYSEIRF